MTRWSFSHLTAYDLARASVGAAITATILAFIFLIANAIAIGSSGTCFALGNPPPSPVATAVRVAVGALLLISAIVAIVCSIVARRRGKDDLRVRRISQWGGCVGIVAVVPCGPLGLVAGFVIGCSH